MTRSSKIQLEFNSSLPGSKQVNSANWISALVKKE
jgi:hypothetical protein